MLQVSTNPSITPDAPVQLEAVAVASADGSTSKASVRLTWKKPGPEQPYVGTDGKTYSDMEQQKVGVMDYSVEYSTEGGADGTWVAAGTQCSGQITECTIEGLPAGTPTVF